MKWLVSFIILVFTFPVLASDQYEEQAKPKWNFSVYLEDNIVLKAKYPMSDHSISVIKQLLQKTRNVFFAHLNITQRCERGLLTIKIISLDDLSNRDYFPGEDDYTDDKGIVDGRYFRSKNTIYIVPFAIDYFWDRVFKHELAHYFYDDCGVRFYNDRDEHKNIREILND